MEGETMTKPADSKQAIPSPEDRVGAIREREQKATKGPWLVKRGHASADRCDGIEAHIGHTHPPEQSCWDVDECPGQDAGKIVETDSGFYGPCADDADFIAHARADIPYLLSLVEELIPFCDSPCGHTSQYAYSEDGGKNIVCLICEVEELKGQAVSASPQPRCPEHKIEMVQKVDRKVSFWGCPNDGCGLFISVELLNQVAQFFVAAPAAEARKRKDYHAEYVEAVEAAEKAERELAIEKTMLPKWEGLLDVHERLSESLVRQLEVTREALQKIGDPGAKVDSLMEARMIARAALTPEPESQAAEEKP